MKIGDKVRFLSESGGGVVAEFDTDKSEQTATIHIAANDPDYAGEYKDTVTFTVAVNRMRITLSWIGFIPLAEVCFISPLTMTTRPLP